MLTDIEIIGRVEDIEKKIREEISSQALNFDLDIDEISSSLEKYIDLLNNLNNYIMDTIVLVKINNGRNGYLITRLIKESELNK